MSLEKTMQALLLILHLLRRSSQFLSRSFTYHPPPPPRIIKSQLSKPTVVLYTTSFCSIRNASPDFDSSSSTKKFARFEMQALISILYLLRRSSPNSSLDPSPTIIIILPHETQALKTRRRPLHDLSLLDSTNAPRLLFRPCYSAGPEDRRRRARRFHGFILSKRTPVSAPQRVLMVILWIVYLRR